MEVYRAEAVELRAGGVGWTKNDDGLGLVNSHTAEVTSIRKDRVRFRLEGGRSLTLRQGDAQLRHLDHAWAPTVHAFQGRTVYNVIAVMESRHPHLSTQKSFYVEIGRARHRADLLTDNAEALREHLESATGERVAALEGIGAEAKLTAQKRRESVLDRPRVGEEVTHEGLDSPVEQAKPEMSPESKQMEYDFGL